MTFEEKMRRQEPYIADYRDTPVALQDRAKKLCWQYNQTGPDEKERREDILRALFGTWTPTTFVEPSFHCDYGFNIHFAGLALVNYNCVMLDTSPITIGKNVFLAPGVCLSCAGHAMDAAQRAAGINTSAPITIGDDVWIGANATVVGGVTIGAGSIIGAGSVVTRDIPAGVVAAGSPCRVLREVTEADKLDLTNIR